MCCCTRWYPPFFFRPPSWEVPPLSADLSAEIYVLDLPLIEQPMIGERLADAP